MGWMNEVGDLLRRYQGASGAAPPASAQTDFDKVARSAPPSTLASALAAAFRSGNTPDFPQLIGQLFEQSNGNQRAGILQHLLAAAGPAAASGGLTGALSSALSSVTPEQAQQVSPNAVKELASRAANRDPSIIDRASEFYSQHPTLVKVLGTAVLAETISHLARHH
jgi:hypothetical protein